MNDEIQQRAKELLEQGAERNKKRFEEMRKEEEKQLLDHFAGLAMQGFISHYGNDGSYHSLAEMSYQVADAMLKARKEVYSE